MDSLDSGFNFGPDTFEKITTQEDRDEFRKYLQKTGVTEKLTEILLLMYHTNPLPENPIQFVMENLCDDCDEKELEIAELQKKIDKLKEQMLEKKEKEVDGAISDISLKMEMGVDEMKEDDDCHHLLKQVLNDEIYDELFDVETEFHGRLLDCIQSGLNYRETEVGCFACDASAYTLYEPLFEALIEELHEADESHPETDWGDPSELEDLDPAGHFIKSTRIMCFRSLEKSPFNPIDTLENMVINMAKISEYLKRFSGELKGTFYDIEDFNEHYGDLRDELKARNLIFDDNDPTLRAARNYRFWPRARGIFVSDDKKLVIWVNAEEHMQIMAQEDGGHLGVVYERVVKCMEQLATFEELKFNHDSQWGFLNFNPANIGIALRATIDIKLVKAGSKEHKKELEDIAGKYNIKIDGVSKKPKKVRIIDEMGEKKDTKAAAAPPAPEKPKTRPKKKAKLADEPAGPKNVFNFTTSDNMLGITEIDAMKEFHRGIREIIRLERCSQ